MLTACVGCCCLCRGVAAITTTLVCVDSFCRHLTTWLHSCSGCAACLDLCSLFTFLQQLTRLSAVTAHREVSRLTRDIGEVLARREVLAHCEVLDNSWASFVSSLVLCVFLLWVWLQSHCLLTTSRLGNDSPLVSAQVGFHVLTHAGGKRGISNLKIALRCAFCRPWNVQRGCLECIFVSLS